MARHKQSAAPNTEKIADRKSTRLNSSHSQISYAVFCLKKKKNHVFHAQLTRLFPLWYRHVGDAFRRVACLAVIGPAAQQDADVPPVAAACARLSQSEH